MSMEQSGENQAPNTEVRLSTEVLKTRAMRLIFSIDDLEKRQELIDLINSDRIRFVNTEEESSFEDDIFTIDQFCRRYGISSN